MKKQFDSRLTHKIRSELNHYRPAYQAADWLAMEAKLQAHLPSRLSMMAKPYLLVSACLLSVFIVLLPLNKQTPEPSPNFNRALHAMETPPKAKNTAQASGSLAQSGQAEPITELPATVADKPFVAQQRATSPPLLANVGMISTVVPTIAASPISVPPVRASVYAPMHLAPINPKQMLASGGPAAQELLPMAFPKMPNPYQPKVEVSFVSSLISNYRPELRYEKRNYGGGLLFNVLVGERLAIGSGMLYNRQTSDGLVERTVRVTENRRTVAYQEVIPTSATFQLIDLPISLQYRFKSRRKLSMYLTAGISNLLYLDEKYQQTRFPILSNGRRFNHPTTETKDYGNWHRFDPLANFTFGFGVKHHFNPVSSLAIEPFLNLPRKNFGDQQIPVRAAGVHLKFNFGVWPQKH